MRLTVHHTCSEKGNPEEIAEQGPFYSDHQEAEDRFKFLGAGYYFWDDNVSIAHWWGKSRYQRQYFIFEGNIDAKGEWLLDLVGNRGDLHWMRYMLQQLEEAHEKRFTLSEANELLKRNNAFPFRVIRAADAYFKPRMTRQFVPTDEHFINLNPVYIVCTTDINKDLLISFNQKHPQ